MSYLKPEFLVDKALLSNGINTFGAFSYFSIATASIVRTPDLELCVA